MSKRKTAIKVARSIIINSINEDIRESIENHLLVRKVFSIIGLELNQRDFKKSTVCKNFLILLSAERNPLNKDWVIETAISLLQQQQQRRITAIEDRYSKWPTTLGQASEPIPRIVNPPTLQSPNFYNTVEWRRLRCSILRQRGNLCEACGRGPIDGISIHVDHIKPRSLFPEQALSSSNLQILCADCNIGKSNLHADDWR